jgi:anaerobic nitric oxide reductase flavorubredoxin
LRGAVFDDQCHDITFYERESLRYFVTIVAKFTGPVLKAIDKLKDVPVKVIAPSHGLIWRKNPGRIVELYKKWSTIGTGKKEVTFLYGSMYGNTEMMMNAVADGISHEGVNVEIFDVARTHASYILPSLWTRAGVAIGAPTYEGSLFPPMVQLLEMAVIKRILHKKAIMFGSYGWSGGALKKVQSIIEPVKWDLLDTFVFNGGPTPDDLKRGFELGAGLAREIKNLSE